MGQILGWNMTGCCCFLYCRANSGWNKRFKFVLLGKWQGGIRGLGFVLWGNGGLQ